MDKQPSTVHELKTITSLKECPPAIFILSPDIIRRERIINILLSQFSELDHQGVSIKSSITKWNASDINDKTLQIIKQEIHSLSLFSFKRFFIVSNIELLNAATLKELKEILITLPKDVKFILHGKKLSSSTLQKEFEAKKCLLSLDELKGFELKRWVQKELKQSGITSYPDDTLDIIIGEGEENPDRIIKIIEKIALYVNESELLEGELAKFLIREPGVSEFDFIDRLNEKKSVEAERLLIRLLRSGKSPFPLLALLSRAFSQLFTMKFLEHLKKSPQEVREQMSLPPWLFKKLEVHSKRYSLKELRATLKLVLSVDSKLKNKSLGPEALFREFIEKSV